MHLKWVCIHIHRIWCGYDIVIFMLVCTYKQHNEHLCHRWRLWYRLSLQWRHNERNGVSKQQPRDCLLRRLLRLRSKKISKLRFTGLCARNSPMTGEFPAPVTPKMFPFDDVIMISSCIANYEQQLNYWVITIIHDVVSHGMRSVRKICRGIASRNKSA